VINYDRRGRGDSGEAGPVSVQHEIEDIAALIEAVGGRASLWGVGIPAPLVAVMTVMPMFRRFAVNGLTLPFDYAALGDHNMHGSPLRPDEWAAVTCPTLVAYGSKTVSGLAHASRSLAEVLPNAELRELPGQNHNVSPGAIVPLLAEFVAAPVEVVA
jgi:pimeloyl-ACP methyl ester carboxylesterase